MTASISGKNLILALTSEDEAGDRVEGAEDSLSAIVGVRTELAGGDLRPLYLAWLAAYGNWENDEEAFDEEDEEELEPPVPAGLGALTAPQRALADFLRLDADLLAVAARESPHLAEDEDGPAELANWIEELPAGDRNTYLLRVAGGHGNQVQMELLRRFRGEPDTVRADESRRTVAELLDSAAEIRHERDRRAEAARASQAARREQERAQARTKRLDALAGDKEAAWARIDALIETRKPDAYDAAVDLLKDLQAVADRVSRPQEFSRRFALLRTQHLRKPSLIARFDRADLTVTT